MLGIVGKSPKTNQKEVQGPPKGDNVRKSRGKIFRNKFLVLEAVSAF